MCDKIVSSSQLLQPEVCEAALPHHEPSLVTLETSKWSPFCDPGGVAFLFHCTPLKHRLLLVYWHSGQF